MKLELIRPPLFLALGAATLGYAAYSRQPGLFGVALTLLGFVPLMRAR